MVRLEEELDRGRSGVRQCSEGGGEARQVCSCSGGVLHGVDSIRLSERGVRYDPASGRLPWRAGSETPAASRSGNTINGLHLRNGGRSQEFEKLAVIESPACPFASLPIRTNICGQSVTTYPPRGP